MTRPSIRVDGAAELRRALAKIDNGLVEFKQVNQDAAEVVAERTEQTAPRRTGRLARSTKARATNREGFVDVGDGLDYAGYVVLGLPSRNIEPNPFPYDAADDRVNQVVDVYEDGIDALIRRHGLT